jgi:hypothetical protein
LVYFDAAFVAKCYLNEPNAQLVRHFAYQAGGLASCEIARVEFYSVLHRHLREGNINSQEVQAILEDFEEDERDGVWQWFPMPSPLIRSACENIGSLRSATFCAR